MLFICLTKQLYKHLSAVITKQKRESLDGGRPLQQRRLIHTHKQVFVGYAGLFGIIFCEA